MDSMSPKPNKLFASPKYKFCQNPEPLNKRDWRQEAQRRKIHIKKEHFRTSPASTAEDKIRISCTYLTKFYSDEKHDIKESWVKSQTYNVYINNSVSDSGLPFLESTQGIMEDQHMISSRIFQWTPR